SVGPFSVDSTPPDKPTSLTATPGHFSAYLQWQAPAPDGGCATVTGYYVYYKLSNGGSYQRAYPTPTAPTHFTVKGLTNGVSYDFAVSAVDSQNREGPMATIPGVVIGVPHDLNGDGVVDISDVLICINVMKYPTHYTHEQY